MVLIYYRISNKSIDGPYKFTNTALVIPDICDKTAEEILFIIKNLLLFIIIIILFVLFIIIIKIKLIKEKYVFY